MRIAVIGSGISGMGAAYYLSRKHEVFLFEKESRLGGHTHTVTVESSQGTLAVDTGFIVHNDRTYPNLVRLFSELGVETQPSDMSFAVACQRTGFEYSSRGLNGFFAQRANLLRLDQHRLLREILRFNREATKLLDNSAVATMTLGDVMEQGRYPALFTERYLYPMASAVWSMSTDEISRFPALTLLRFFDNHGMLGINTHPKWKVVRGGSRNYIRPITAPYQDRIYTDVHIRSVARDETGVTLHLQDRPSMRFDQVVFTCHGNQILPLLEAPTDREKDVLGRFTTSRNEVCLHSDSRLLPGRPQARASWNYLPEPGPGRRGHSYVSHEPAAVVGGSGRLLRYVKRQRQHRSRQGSAPDGLPSSCCTTAAPLRRKTAGARSAAGTALIFAARTGFTVFTKTG